MSEQKTAGEFSSFSTSLKIAAYAVSWALLLPVVLLYLFARSRKDPRYRHFIHERFGIYSTTADTTLWVHANSLGEIRSAAPIIKNYLDRGLRIVVTNMTPAGRHGAQTLFSNEIAAGQVIVVYVPFEFDWAYRLFFKAFNPKAGLAMEAEIWPRMVASAKKYGVPLILCNAQYSIRKKRKERGRFLSNICTGYAGIMAKSDLQAKRFEHIGCQNIVVTGETRFDLIIPPALLSASAKLKEADVFNGRPVLTLASVVEGEDGIYEDLIKGLHKKARDLGEGRPFVIYVPRARERFGPTADTLSKSFDVAKRSELFDQDLKLKRPLNKKVDILVGDSFGEMYFYLDLANAVLVGGGFLPAGAHNIIEPIAVSKPVFVGPSTWSIEYPSMEAIAAGILVQEETIQDLGQRIFERLYIVKNSDNIDARVKAFYAQHTGADKRVVNVLPDIIRAAGYPKIAKLFSA